VIDNNLFIRGIGSGVNSGFERSVGTYVDGLYIGRSELSRTPFLDVARVEVLKGPQGILFGKNTIAGAVNVTTADPTDYFEGQADVYVDPQHGETRINAMVSGPINAKVAGRLAVNYQAGDGYFEKSFTGEDVIGTNYQSVRGKLRWLPSESIVATLKLEHADFDDDGRAMFVSYAGPGSAFEGLESEHKTVGGSRPAAQQFHDTLSDIASLTVDYTFAGHKLTFISGYLEYAADQLIDALGTDFFATPGDGAFFTVDTDEDFSQLSQEIRLLSPQEASFSYLLGAYLQRNDLHIERNVVWPVGGRSHRRTEQEGASVALFAQANWQLSSRWTFTAGARYNRESKDFERLQMATPDVPPNLSAPFLAFELDRDISKVTGALTAQYRFSDSGMAYLSLSSGFKDGGFDESRGRQLAPGEDLATVFEFDEETVDSIELGGKFRLADGKTELQVAAFRSEYKDLQTSVFNGVAGFSVANAATSVTQGLELELRRRVTSDLLVTVSFAYLDAYYDNFSNGACSQWHAANTTECMGLTRDLSNQSLPFAADIAGNLDFEYDLPSHGNIDAWVNFDVFYSDAFQTASDLDPLTRQSSYFRFDLRLAMAAADRSWEIALLGKNLTNEFVLSWMNDVTFSSTPGRANTYTGLAEPPRTIALQGTVRF
jgi:iron complex outermembrane receptor protein